jgi:hypothetical protein
MVSIMVRPKAQYSILHKLGAFSLNKAGKLGGERERGREGERENKGAWCHNYATQLLIFASNSVLYAIPHEVNSFFGFSPPRP